MIESRAGESFDHPNTQGWALREVFERMMLSHFDKEFAYGTTLVSSEHLSKYGNAHIPCSVDIKYE